MNTLAINRAIVAIEQDKHQAMNRMRAALTQLGDLRIQLEPIFPVYPAGGERQLIQVLTGKEVPAGGLPIDIGILCQNVATLVAIYQAVVKGSPLISRITTITGSGISRPGNFQVLLGTPISALADAAGGYTQFASRLIMGGPMMGIALTCDDVPVVKATNCILVMEEAELRPTLDNMPCIRCGECEQVCPAQLQPQELYWRIRGGNLVGADELGLTACIECGCCDLVCPSHIPLSQHYRFAKAQVRTARLKREQSDIARQRFENRQLRLDQEATRRKQRLEEKRKARSSGRDDTKEIKGEIDAILARTENRQPGAGEKDETP
jgi:electron transport complex protein RnfC